MSGVIGKLTLIPKKLFEPLRRRRNWLLHTFGLWLIAGGCYYVIEGIWRICSNGGWANITMLPVGGLCGVLIGIMNQNPKFARKKMVLQAVYGMAVLVVVEFVCGYIMNIRMGLNIWDYSSRPLNFMGQICLAYAALWFLFTPFIIWFDDYVRFKIWDEGERYSWYTNYVKLFTLK
ncbi:MAG: putative ABC transporter permease [Defluviitaleaceae bacterium]|nr:putative ABC transporter permease [Defluviitaleaceae bacterium]MCL2836785.1 putative ABC transporter permease [Defluviitaleaceae bacterium]